jgi:hypothetical protein
MYYCASVLSTWLYVQPYFCHLACKNGNNPACVEVEVSISDMLSEELEIVSSDEMNLENEGQSASRESSNTSSESECESETNVACIDECEDVTMGDKELNAYTFTKNAGPQFHLLPDAEPMDYFSMTSY